MVDIVYREERSWFKRAPFASFPLFERLSLNSLFNVGKESWSTEEEKLLIDWEADPSLEKNIAVLLHTVGFVYSSLYVLNVFRLLNSTPNTLHIRGHLSSSNDCFQNT